MDWDGDGLSDILYRSADVEVRRVAGGGAGTCQVVTFHSYHDGNGLDHPGFGEGFLAREGIDAVHVLCRGNHWYQYAEMPAVTAAIHDATAGAERVVTYGSSMGGYAAIRFAAAVGADIALAISPQYSADPRKVRFETRWLHDQKQIRHLPELNGPIGFGGRIVIAYDPELRPDRLHVERFEADATIDQIRLPHAGHPASTFLNEIGLLQPLVRMVVANELDIPAFTRDVAERAPTSPAYLIGLSAGKPPVEAIALAERAVAMAPDAAYVAAALSDRLGEAGNWPKAVEAQRRAVEREPILAYRWSFAKALAAARHHEEALAVTRTLQAETPTMARYHRHAANLLAAMGDNAGALVALRGAIRCAPDHLGHRWLAFKLVWRLRWARWFGKR